MAASTLRRDDDVKDDRTATARTFLGGYMPLAGVGRYAIFGEGDPAEGRAKIGPVGWRRRAEMPGTRPKISWTARHVRR